MANCFHFVDFNSDTSILKLEELLSKRRKVLEKEGRLEEHELLEDLEEFREANRIQAEIERNQQAYDSKFYGNSANCGDDDDDEEDSDVSNANMSGSVRLPGLACIFCMIQDACNGNASPSITDFHFPRAS